MERDEAIKKIRTALKTRTGKAWSVRGGEGTAWGWISIKSTPKKSADGFGTLSSEQRMELAKTLGLPEVSDSGVSIAASSDYREEYVARAEGRTPTVTGKVYWD